MILFKPEHVDMILSGQKYQTRRQGRRRWKVGGIHACYTRPPFAKGGAKPFCRVRILDVHPQPLGSMALWEAKAEGYPTRDLFVDAWTRINGPNSWAPRLPVWVVTFEVEP